ncbi:MAG: AIPR family protein, partial [Chitinophagales bacterium]
NSYNEHLYKAYYKEEISFFIYDSYWIYEKISSIAKNHRAKVEFAFHPENSNFSLLDNQALYTFSIGNTRAANFRILATEICELIEKEKSINGSFDLLFEENIRQYLGTSKFKANREMNKTLNSEDAVLFPFLNNGITIITEQITVPKSAQDGKYNLPVVNPQIVNGLQTSRVLYD